MNKKVTICLSVLILFLLLVIAAGVYELYRDVPTDGAVADTSVLCQEADSTLLQDVATEITAD